MVPQRILALILLLSGSYLFAQIPDSLDVPPEPVAEEQFVVEPEDREFRLAEINKADVIEFIDQQRSFGFPEPLPFDYTASPIYPSTYRAGFDFTGLGNQEMRIHREGFRLPESMLSNWQYLGYHSQFHQPAQQGNAIDATHLAYELPVSLSRLQGSLGDYDSRYALGSFAKGHLLGVPGLSVQYDYFMSNSWWLDASSSGSSARQYLVWRNQNYMIWADYATYTKESGSYELHPAYWHLGNLRNKNKHSELVAGLQTPWLDLGLASFRDRNSSASYTQAWHHQSLQMMISRRIKFFEAQMTLRHEYRDLQRNYMPAYGINQEDYKNLSTINLESPYLADVSLKFELEDWEQPSLEGSATKTLGAFSLGIDFNHHFDLSEPPIAITNIRDGGLMDYAAISIPRETSVFAKLVTHGLDLKASFGKRKQEQHLPGSKYSADPLIARLGAVYKYDLGDFVLKLDSIWNYQEFDSFLMYAPEFNFTSAQSIGWQLPHDNMLEAGFSLYGHSQYYLANAQNPVLIDASTITDAWATVRISKLFDFTVTAKNIFSTTVYGLYPIPMSLHAGLRWYFIN